MVGRKVLITGAASGIGKAVSVLLAGEGASLALIDADESVRSLAREGLDAALVADLEHVARLPGVVDSAATPLGGLDGIVNCAGRPSLSRLGELSVSQWQSVMTINLTAPFVICQAAVSYLQKSVDAAIVNVSSASALHPTIAIGCDYVASKAGLLGLTRALALQLAPQVRVNAVCPGLTQTPMMDAAMRDWTPRQRQPIRELFPLGRVADPLEIAQVISFLLSSAASYVTGASYTADGGRALY